MVNLFFIYSAKKYQNLIPMKNESSVVEVVLFDINQGYSKEEATQALKSLNEVIKLYYGFIERTTAFNEAGKYIDIIYWKNMKSAKEAAKDMVKNPEAQEAFKVIKPESIQMFHFNSFNQYEG
ncbi:hypothetical protein [Aquimarina sp. MMG016]|uniref:hypothetical protein n=1 Tax=Aquimarina sp. MMG016 TaxID=2822690 RepID=UPI001B3A049E|nr:hypothetical protein [Aquimarina sp. MMG016]MBQ4819442.1 hypothetical protein [Aquimarina sp. MMG016]